ncbi:MAG TPA: hypothetical protein VFI41_04650 [Gemmatimonadales bacterium]|nr:hypothetical protein [Gemmatimonadales bacterium]
MEKIREPLSCPDCKVPWYIQKIQGGWATVRPDHWWRPNTVMWVAGCGCRTLTGQTEGDLYRQMPGVIYA